ncbi:hypothetical protein ILYODFUR_009077 [Ilyodon furcidens]|uniref:PiggyBac transposable element-derived protein domain-containing protein n=1 Tax=Ilyodon furcidens TaxID=33524 RepID=A0ABV0V1K7_9TELE
MWENNRHKWSQKVFHNFKTDTFCITLHLTADKNNPVIKSIICTPNKDVQKPIFHYGRVYVMLWASFSFQDAIKIELLERNTPGGSHIIQRMNIWRSTAKHGG